MVIKSTNVPRIWLLTAFLGDRGARDDQLWQCRTLPDRPVADRLALANTGSSAGTHANARAGSSASARTGTFTNPAAFALKRRRPAGDDFAESGSVERQSDSELLAHEHVDLHADSRQRRVGGTHDQRSHRLLRRRSLQPEERPRHRDPGGIEDNAHHALLQRERVRAPHADGLHGHRLEEQPHQLQGAGRHLVQEVGIRDRGLGIKRLDP